MRIYTLCMCWFCVVGSLSAQSPAAFENNHGWFFITEIGYLSGTGNVTIDNVELSNEGFGARLRFIAGHRISNHFAGGLGFGLDGYHEPDYNTFPIFVDVRGYLKDVRSTPFAFLDLGYALEITDKFEKGVFTNLGIGYKLFFGLFGRKVHFLPSAGINLQKVHRDRQIIVTTQFPPQFETIKDNISVKSFTVNLGIEF